MAISEEKKELVAKLLDDLNLGTKKAALGQVILALIDEVAQNAGDGGEGFSGDYADLTNKPTLFTGDYADLSNKPTLFGGNYESLSNKPTIPALGTITLTGAVTGTGTFDGGGNIEIETALAE